MQIEVYLSIGFPTAEHHDTIEVEDDLTEDQIAEEVREWAYNYIDYGWK